MSRAKTPSQSVPRASSRKGDRDGVNSQADRRATGGGSDAAPYPNPQTGKDDDERDHVADGPLSHGGQSKMKYHGSGRLGRDRTRRDGNENVGD